MENIGIITQPIGQAGVVPLSNLVKIIGALSDSTWVITGCEGNDICGDNNVQVLSLPYRDHSSIFFRLINHLLMQFRISINILKLRSVVGTWIFFLDSHSFLFPVITAKVCKKKLIFVLAASIRKSAEPQKQLLDNGLIFSEAFCFRLADRIVLYARNLIEDWELKRYEKKIAVAHEHFFDLKCYREHSISFSGDKTIACIGRLSPEKGVLNYIQAVPQVLQKRTDINFLIAGDGRLGDEIDKYLNEEGLCEKVKNCGWIPHHCLAEYFSKIHLLVIPSYSEGLPNIMLEAMACGIPVLAAGVGAIPEIIKDGRTGFILADNSPECIADNIIRALDYPHLEQIAQNARLLIQRCFSFEAAVSGYREIILDMENSNHQRIKNKNR